jgi:hypothetical protein
MSSPAEVHLDGLAVAFGGEVVAGVLDRTLGQAASIGGAPTWRLGRHVGGTDPLPA